MAGALFPTIGAADTLTIERFFQVGMPVPEGGEVLYLHPAEFGNATIGEVRVGLNLTGIEGPMANGDWFVGLGHEAGGYTVLLNRVGKTADWPFGYLDNGLDVSFRDGAPDIHLYRDFTGPLGSGPLTGEWSPSGRTTLPEQVVDTDPRHATLESFAGHSASGEWRLLLSHEATGGAARLESWSLAFDLLPATEGAMRLSWGDRITTAGSVTIAAEIHLEGPAHFAHSGEIHLQGRLRGSGTLLQDGPGRLVLSDEADFLGAVAVSDGELRVINLTGSATGTAAVSVTGNGTLRGTGAIGGPVSIFDGGVLAPGASPGTLAAGSMEWGAGGFYDVEINFANGTPGGDAGWDFLQVADTLSFTAQEGDPFTVRLISLDPSNGFGALTDFDPHGTYRWLIASAGTITGQFASIILDTTHFVNHNAIEDGWHFFLSQNQGNLYLNYIPEPRAYTVLAGFLGLLLVLSRQRMKVRRRRQAT